MWPLKDSVELHQKKSHVPRLGGEAVPARLAEGSRGWCPVSET